MCAIIKVCQQDNVDIKKAPQTEPRSVAPTADPGCEAFCIIVLNHPAYRVTFVVLDYSIMDLRERQGEHTKYKCSLVSSDGGNERRFPMSITIKEYNKLRYRQRKNFVSEVKSRANMLRALGCVVTFPPDDELNSAIDKYLENRPRRDRIDWEAVE